ncbi:MAG: response regulator [Gammaproteobacteria bacterium]|nr:MAG: response regulator [Gammaproteobacteria bacterium]
MLKNLQFSNTIFLVDDEPINQKLLEKILHKAGYTNLVHIYDPSQVLEKYHKYKPDLILLDIRMPGMSGFEVMDQLNRLNDPLMPPVIFLTAEGNEENLLQALDRGARDLMQKPFNQSELLMKVRNMLDLHIAHKMLNKKYDLLEQVVSSRTRELRETRLKVVERLGMAAEYRDDETGNHIKRMSHICSFLAGKLEMESRYCEEILHASPMHDVGKLGIPDHILLKPGKLTSDEMTVMKQHTEIGRTLLDGDDSSLMVMAREIAYTHHEKWDGSGYPQGLKGQAIPLCGRIAALADVFDALASNRPYKQAWELPRIIEFLVEQKGRHFDPELVELLLSNLEEICEIRGRFS